MNTLGSRISQLRKAKGLTQEGLAEKLGVSSQAVSKWENDVSCPDISLLPALARSLGVTTDELLTGSSDQVQFVPEDQRKPLDQLTLRIRACSADGDKARINLPMPLLKVCLEMGLDITSGMSGMEGMAGIEALQKIDLAKIMDLAERGLIGKLVEAESADGDAVEIVVE